MEQIKDNTIVIDSETKIVYVKNMNFEGFALKFKIKNKWYHQFLMLSCRAGAAKYFEPAKQLYRHIKKQKLTSTTFRRLAV